MIFPELNAEVETVITQALALMVPLFVTMVVARTAPTRDKRQMLECLQAWLPRMCQQVVQRCCCEPVAATALPDRRSMLSAPIRTVVPRNPRHKN